VLGFTVVTGVAVDLVELVVASVEEGAPGFSGSGIEVRPGAETEESVAGNADVVGESAAEEVPQADKTPSPKRARQEKRGFCMPLLNMKFRRGLRIQNILTGGQVVALAVSTVEC
jgi:hypothetical protein